MTEAPLLELRSVSTTVIKGDMRVPVLLDSTFAIGRGEIVGLVGESGSGKSMTARTIIRSLPPGAASTGSVLLDGRDLLTMRSAELRETRSRSIGVIFQDPRSGVDPLWTVEDHLTEGMRVHQRLSRVAARPRALNLLAQVGIRDGETRLAQYPGQLSGGLLQRVVIAGALAGDPTLLIADEPTTALDVTTQADIVSIFLALRRDRGLAMLFITHDLALASSVCDRILVMYAGRVVEVQSRDGILRRPRHPYTHGLISARPSVDERRQRLPVIKGDPASAADTPVGCAFAARCRFAVDQCRKDVPALSPADGDVLVACWRADEVAEELRV
jgi:peptide/nickel transport system ATP-binding protein